MVVVDVGDEMCWLPMLVSLIPVNNIDSAVPNKTNCIKPRKLIMNIFLLTFAIVSCDLEFYDDAEVEFTTHLLTTTEATTLTTPSSTISSSLSLSSTSVTPVLTSKADYEGSGNSTGGSGDGDDGATSIKSGAPEADQTNTKNNSDYEDMNIKILNEPFKDEDLLRKALEMSLQE